MPDYYVYRPRSNWVYLGIAILVGLGVAVSFFYTGFVTEGWVSISNTFAASALLWVFVVSPKVVYTTEGIEIHNPFRTIIVGWLTVDEFTTKYSFTVITASSKYSAWGAPAPSRFNARKIHNSDFRGTGLEERKVVSPNDSPRAESGVALILAEKHRESAIRKGTAGDYITKQINLISLALAASGILALVINFLH
ncbi:MAG: hypothetical protein EBT07_10950 [Actinobacteria bacterium]|nr:hypothetical protein [Actinomycetota bacterium]